MSQDIWEQHEVKETARIEAEMQQMWAEVELVGEICEDQPDLNHSDFDVCLKCAQPRWKHTWMVPVDYDEDMIIARRLHLWIENSKDAEFFLSTWCCPETNTSGHFLFDVTKGND